MSRPVRHFGQSVVSLLTIISLLLNQAAPLIAFSPPPRNSHYK
jgi:hypothetical protein